MFRLRAIPLLGLLISSSTFAAMIDDFSTGQGPVATPIASISGAGILGGSREFVNGASFQAAGGIGAFSTPDGTNNIFSLGYDGSADGAFGTGGFPAVDLTDGGLADLFIVSVTALTSTGQLPPSAALTLSLWDVDSNSASLSFIPVAAPGVFSAALPASGIDLTRIVRAQIPVFLSGAPLATTSLSLDYACTGNVTAGCTSAAAVPEPSAFALLGLGLAALALRRRKP